MELNRFEGMMVAIFVGNIPQQRPADMLVAVRVFDKIPLEATEVAIYNGRPWAELLPLVDKEPIEVELLPEECKFVAKVMVENANFGAMVLRLLIPLWERLYPKWEEFGS